MDLADLALDHEVHSKDNNIDYIEQNFNKLIIELDRIKNVLDSYLKEKIKKVSIKFLIFLIFII